MAYNEAARIARCLHSLPLGDPAVAIHVVVNGSSDQTADIANQIAAQTSNVEVHDGTASFSTNFPNFMKPISSSMAMRELLLDRSMR
jgi:glycosyltransferase involved in cell wall biosynthesis